MATARQRIELYDTTLRDGTQAQNVSLSLNDKLLIAAKRCRANGLGRRLGEIAELAHSSSLPTTLVGEEAHRPISWTSTEAGEGYVILERLGTGAHARDVTTIFLQIIGDLNRLEHH